MNVYGESVDRIWSTYNQQQEVVITTEKLTLLEKQKADGDISKRVDYYIASSDQMLPNDYGSVNEITSADYQGLHDFNDGLAVEYTSSSGLTKFNI